MPPAPPPTPSPRPRRLGPRQVLAIGYHRLRAAWETLWRPSRQRRALARARQVPVGGRILVLCFGNICRSPYAAAVLERLAEQRNRTIHASQGGFFGPDRPANAVALEVASNRGIDLHPHRSRLVTMEDLATASLVLVMEPGHAKRLWRDFGVPTHEPVLLGDLDPGPVASRAIRDPYGRAPEVFEKTFSQIDRCMSVLVDQLPSSAHHRGSGVNGEIGVE